MALFSLARITAVLFALALAANARAQAAQKAIRISFLPPPLEGTISLGIYDAQGKLVRVLQREAELEDFELEQDSVATEWDGKDDAGAPCPAGSYHARGFAVGEIGVEGVGFFFNDWVTEDDAPRIKKISALALDDDAPALRVTETSNRVVTFVCDRAGKIQRSDLEPLPPAQCNEEMRPSAIIAPISCSQGKDDTLWVIDRRASDAAELEVKQLSAARELLRRLAVSASDPQPQQIAAAKKSDTIFLLEENEKSQRVRSLTLAARDRAGEHSDWKTDFARTITAHENFGIENGRPVATGGKPLIEKMPVQLIQNPLKNDARETLELFVGRDAAGSYLRTADGLPLQSISDTRHLARAGFGAANGNAVDVFQDDEAVVEQFHLTGLEQMMAFDAGEIELK